MGSLFSLTFIILSLSFNLSKTKAQEISSPRILDLVIRDYAFKTFTKHLKTGTVHNVHLPSTFSGIEVNTMRLRCGSLRRYGAKIKEFELSIGVIVQPCAERVMLVTQSLGFNWSSMYYDMNNHKNYGLAKYKLVSPILGLLAYNAGNSPYEIEIFSTETPITINFSMVEKEITGFTPHRPMCVSFERDGKFIFEKEASPFACAASKQGHYGLVIETTMSEYVMKDRKISKWKVVLGSSVGCVLGVFLLGLLLVAMLVKGKNKARREELERRGYQEEALQVSMVGHVRALTASATRTMPTIEQRYIHYPT